MKDIPANKAAYPDEDCIADEIKGKQFIPKTLSVLLETIVTRSQIKNISIVHCTSCKSLISPIPFGLGVEVVHVFGCRWLVDQLACLGFSVSYEEVQRCKQSIMQQEQVEDGIPIDQFTQWSADNADHSIATIYRKHTSHGMGIIASTVTPSDKIVASLPSVVRRKEITVKDLIKEKGVPLYQFLDSNGSVDFKMKPLLQLQRQLVWFYAESCS